VRQAETADRHALPEPKSGEAAPQPVDMVVMFDAEGIVGIKGVPGAKDWVTRHIQALASALAGAKDPKAVIQSSPKFRGHFWDRGAYAGNYDTLNEALWTELDNGRGGPRSVAGVAPRAHPSSGGLERRPILDLASQQEL
jgi:hypothetical protein